MSDDEVTQQILQTMAADEAALRNSEEGRERESERERLSSALSDSERDREEQVPDTAGAAKVEEWFRGTLDFVPGAGHPLMANTTRTTADRALVGSSRTEFRPPRGEIAWNDKHKDAMWDLRLWAFQAARNMFPDSLYNEGGAGDYYRGTADRILQASVGFGLEALDEFLTGTLEMSENDLLLSEWAGEPEQNWYRRWTNPILEAIGEVVVAPIRGAENLVNLLPGTGEREGGFAMGGERLTGTGRGKLQGTDFRGQFGYEIPHPGGTGISPFEQQMPGHDTRSWWWGEPGDSEIGDYLVPHTWQGLADMVAIGLVFPYVFPGANAAMGAALSRLNPVRALYNAGRLPNWLMLAMRERVAAVRAYQAKWGRLPEQRDIWNRYQAGEYLPEAGAFGVESSIPQGYAGVITPDNPTGRLTADQVANMKPGEIFTADFPVGPAGVGQTERAFGQKPFADALPQGPVPEPFRPMSPSGTGPATFTAEMPTGRMMDVFESRIGNIPTKRIPDDIAMELIHIPKPELFLERSLKDFWENRWAELSYKERISVTEAAIARAYELDPNIVQLDERWLGEPIEILSFWDDKPNILDLVIQHGKGGVGSDGVSHFMKLSMPRTWANWMSKWGGGLFTNEEFQGILIARDQGVVNSDEFLWSAMDGIRGTIRDWGDQQKDPPGTPTEGPPGTPPSSESRLARWNNMDIAQRADIEAGYRAAKQVGEDVVLDPVELMRFFDEDIPRYVDRDREAAVHAASEDEVETIADLFKIVDGPPGTPTVGVGDAMGIYDDVEHAWQEMFGKYAADTVVRDEWIKEGLPPFDVQHYPNSPSLSAAAAVVGFDYTFGTGVMRPGAADIENMSFWDLADSVSRQRMFLEKHHPEYFQEMVDELRRRGLDPDDYMMPEGYADPPHGDILVPAQWDITALTEKAKELDVLDVVEGRRVKGPDFHLRTEGPPGTPAGPEAEPPPMSSEEIAAREANDQAYRLAEAEEKLDNYWWQVEQEMGPDYDPAVADMFRDIALDELMQNPNVDLEVFMNTLMQWTAEDIGRAMDTPDHGLGLAGYIQLPESEQEFIARSWMDEHPDLAVPWREGVVGGGQPLADLMDWWMGQGGAGSGGLPAEGPVQPWQPDWSGMGLPGDVEGFLTPEQLEAIREAILNQIFLDETGINLEIFTEAEHIEELMYAAMDNFLAGKNRQDEITALDEIWRADELEKTLYIRVLNTLSDAEHLEFQTHMIESAQSAARGGRMDYDMTGQELLAALYSLYPSKFPDFPDLEGGITMTMDDPPEGYENLSPEEVERVHQELIDSGILDTTPQQLFERIGGYEVRGRIGEGETIAGMSVPDEQGQRWLRMDPDRIVQVWRDGLASYESPAMDALLEMGVNLEEFQGLLRRGFRVDLLTNSEGFMEIVNSWRGGRPVSGRGLRLTGEYALMGFIWEHEMQHFMLRHGLDGRERGLREVPANEAALESLGLEPVIQREEYDYSMEAEARNEASFEESGELIDPREWGNPELEPEVAAVTETARTTERFTGMLTPEVLQANPDKYYLFGDNVQQMDSTHPGGRDSGQAVIRGQPNAIGIPTKIAPNNRPEAFMTDATYDANVAAIDRAFAKIPEGATVVIPEANGQISLGTGRANLNRRESERTWKYLQDKLAALEGPSEVAAPPGTPAETGPVISMPMNFVYGEGGALSAGEGVTAANTFDAIVAGERTATSRANLPHATEVGSTVRFFRGEDTVDVRVTDLRHVSETTPEEWARLEGYDLEEAREALSGRYRNYKQIVFEVIEPSAEGGDDLLEYAWRVHGETSTNIVRGDSQAPYSNELSQFYLPGPRRAFGEPNPVRIEPTGEATALYPTGQAEPRSAGIYGHHRSVPVLYGLVSIDSNLPVITVHGRNNQNLVLSNFYEAPFEFEGHTFASAEGAYHAFKRGRYVRGFEHLGGAAALARARRINVPTDQSITDDLMARILAAKFQQVPEFAEELLATGLARIIHPVRDPHWGTDGNDAFAQALMNLRDVEMHREAPDQYQDQSTSHLRTQGNEFSGISDSALNQAITEFWRTMWDGLSQSDRIASFEMGQAGDLPEMAHPDDYHGWRNQVGDTLPNEAFPFVTDRAREIDARWAGPTPAEAEPLRPIRDVYRDMMATLTLRLDDVFGFPPMDELIMIGFENEGALGLSGVVHSTQSDFAEWSYNINLFSVNPRGALDWLEWYRNQQTPTPPPALEAEYGPGVELSNEAQMFIDEIEGRWGGHRSDGGWLARRIEDGIRSLDKIVTYVAEHPEVGIPQPPSPEERARQAGAMGTTPDSPGSEPGPDAHRNAPEGGSTFLSADGDRYLPDIAGTMGGFEGFGDLELPEVFESVISSMETQVEQFVSADYEPDAARSERRRILEDLDDLEGFATLYHRDMPGISQRFDDLRTIMEPPISDPTELQVHTIISGGQVGADQAGWEAAIDLGLETGGQMPRGFRTHFGNDPDVGALYGATESASRDWPPRTRENIRNSDATIIFTRNLPFQGIWMEGNVIVSSEVTRPLPSEIYDLIARNSPGSRLTIDLARNEGKPFVVVSGDAPPIRRVFRSFLIGMNIGTLNVAGPRGMTNTRQTTQTEFDESQEYQQTIREFLNGVFTGE